MKLEIGKIYKTKTGTKVGIIGTDPDSNVYEGYIVYDDRPEFKDVAARIWTENGTVHPECALMFEDHTVLDLVEVHE